MPHQTKPNGPRVIDLATRISESSLGARLRVLLTLAVVGAAAGGAAAVITVASPSWVTITVAMIFALSVLFLIRLFIVYNLYLRAAEDWKAAINSTPNDTRRSLLLFQALASFVAYGHTSSDKDEKQERVR